MMNRNIAISVVMIFGFMGASSYAHEPHECPADLADAPAIAGHIDQGDIVDGTHKFEEVFEVGRQLFVGIFNTCDGQGRPATTGTGNSREPDQPSFIRTSGPDSSSCAD
jgi:hypothetical protein